MTDDRMTPNPRSLHFSTLAALCTLLLFILVLLNVMTDGVLVTWDSAIYEALQNARTPAADLFLITVTQLGDTFMVTTLAIVMTITLLAQRRWRTAGYWVAAIVSAAVINTAIKALVYRARPGDLLYSGWSAYSFPSGHTTANIVMYGFLAILLYSSSRGLIRIVAAAILLCLPLLIGFSRIYLGAHWFSDVLAGALLAATLLCLLGHRYLSASPLSSGPAWLLLPVAATLAIAGTFHAHNNRDFDLVRYRHAPATQQAQPLPGAHPELPR